MQIAIGPNHQVYVATRREVIRFPVDSKKLTQGQVESLLRLETVGDYPHNGLSGMTFDRRGNLYLGMGENLGVPYQLQNNYAQSLHGGGKGAIYFDAISMGETSNALRPVFGIHLAFVSTMLVECGPWTMIQTRVRHVDCCT